MVDLAVVGCGPVAICAIICALEYKPARVFAIDSIPARLNRAAELGCIPINFEKVDAATTIIAATQGRGVPAVIEAVGHTSALKTAYDIIAQGGKISSVGRSLSSLDNSLPHC